MGVVKADAYGNGAVPVSRFFRELGAEYLGVSNLEEALQLRNAEIDLPILILGKTPAMFSDILADQKITQTITDLDYAQSLSHRLSGSGKRLKVHIKADTGMSRLGFMSYGAISAVDEIREAVGLPGLIPEGIFTHFAESDAPDRTYTELQYQRFCSVLEQLHPVNFEIRHCCNSAAAIRYPEYGMDMIRPGIAVYGLLPSPEMKDLIDLKPVMELKTSVYQIKELEPEVTVSYGRTFKTKEKTKIAVLPIGYADGFSRLHSNHGEVLIHGQRARIVGRICMDMCMIDVTHIPGVRVGDVVTVFGRDGNGFIPMDELAEFEGTITYEVSCGISKRVSRIYYRNGEICESLGYIM